MRRSFVISILAFVVIFSILLIERVRASYPLELTNIAISSLIYLIIIVPVLFLGEKFLRKNPGSKKIFSKMPLYSLIPAFIAAQVYSSYYYSTTNWISGHGGGILIGMIPLLIVSGLIISLFLATLLFFESKTYHYIVTAIALLFITISLIYTGIYVNSCGIDGCYDAKQMALEAINDFSRCELMRPGNATTRYVILSPSKIHMPFAQTKEKCYWEIAKLKNDPSLCELATYYADKCYKDFESI